MMGSPDQRDRNSSAGEHPAEITTDGTGTHNNDIFGLHDTSIIGGEDHMKKTLLLAGFAVIAAAILPLYAAAQDAAAVIDASAKAMGGSSLQSLRYTGTGTNNSTGQAYAPGGPWPRF